MKILFILPRFNKGFGTVYNENETGIDYDYLMPVGMAYIVAYLKRAGYDVTALNLNQVPGRVKEIVQREVAFGKYDVVFTGSISIMYPAVRDIVRYVHEVSSGTKVVVGGGILSSDPELMMKLLDPDYGIIFEGEETSLELVRCIESGGNVRDVSGLIFNDGEIAIRNKPRPAISDLDALPFPDLDAFGYPEYLQHQELGGWNQYPRSFPPRPYMIAATRSCPMACLAGDTTIDTTNGKFKIKDLVGTYPKVLTRDPITKDVLYAQCSEVMQTGVDKELVRVTFREGSYIDCTSDHLFTRFTKGTKKNPTQEYETNAADLKHGDHVRAVHYETQPDGHVIISWGRRKRSTQHKMVMESIIGRKLSSFEHVHHKDHNAGNNVESNLQLTDRHEHVSVYHPEVSQRMKENNPSKNLPHEFFVNLGKSQKGKVRSPESRLRYRAAQMGENNSNYRSGLHTGMPSRIPEVNHVVEKVEILSLSGDTYCLEVPGYDWFYANDVLVHNCTFCFHTTGHKYRQRSIENIMSEVKYAVEKYKINFFTFLDECFAYDKPRALEFCRQFREYAETVPWRIEMYCNLRVDCADGEILDAMKSAGNVVIGLGLESYSQVVLDSMKKHITPKQIKDTLQMIRDRDLVPQGGFIFGDPAETLETAHETLEFIRSHPEFSRGGLFVGFIIPFPGTEVYLRALKEGIIRDEVEFIEKLTSTEYNYDNIYNFTSLSDEDFDRLKDAVFTLKYTFIPTSVPTMRANAGGQDEIFVDCPHCGLPQSYKTSKHPHEQYSVGVICNNCNGRFEMSTQYMELGRMAVRLIGFRRMRIIKNKLLWWL
jgi:radical SAM superfamily enzyme YgiQ (UPF0313 family)